MDACVHMDFTTIPSVRNCLARRPHRSKRWSADSGWSSGPTQFAPPPRRGRSGGRELTALRTNPFAGLLRRADVFASR